MVTDMVVMGTVGTDTAMGMVAINTAGTVTADMPTRAGMEVMATRVTTTPTFITTTITIMGMVIGGMVVGGAMASAPAGVGRPTVMSGSADTDSISTPAAFPARPPLAMASPSAIDRRTWHNGVVPKLRDGQPGEIFGPR